MITEDNNTMSVYLKSGLCEEYKHPKIPDGQCCFRKFIKKDNYKIGYLIAWKEENKEKISTKSIFIFDSSTEEEIKIELKEAEESLFKDWKKL